MEPNYSEQDSERVRRAESRGVALESYDTSAGRDTQRISLDPQYEPITPAEPSVSVIQQTIRRPNGMLGIALIVVGLFLLLVQMLVNPGSLIAGMILLIIASCFFFFSFWKRIYGLMIPACILSGLSVGVTFAGITSGVSVLWGLALGFFAIMVIGNLVFQERETWPVIPAVIMFAVGMIVLVAQLPTLFIGGAMLLPMLLIGLGLFLGSRR